MSEKHKSIVKEVSQSFEKNDLEGFLQHCTDDVAWTIVGDTTTKGKDAVRQWMNSMGGDMAHLLTSLCMKNGGAMLRGLTTISFWSDDLTAVRSGTAPANA